MVAGAGLGAMAEVAGHGGAAQAGRVAGALAATRRSVRPLPGRIFMIVVDFMRYRAVSECV